MTIKAKTIQAKTFFGMQYLEKEYWHFDEETLSQFEKLMTDPRKNQKEIFALVCEKFRQDYQDDIVTLAIVLQDKDINENGKLEAPHLHWAIHLKERTTLNKIAKAFQVEPQYIETGNQGKNAMIGRLAYLTHQTEPDKFHYDPQDVETFGTFDYVNFVNNNKMKFKKLLATKRYRATKYELNHLLQQVQVGKLFIEDILSDEKYYFVYANNLAKFKEAFEAYAQRNSLLTIQDRVAQKFEFTSIYIYGKSGSGKSEIAYDILKQIELLSQEVGLRWHSYFGGSKNAVDDYKGEELLLFDDVRSETFSPADWTKILDYKNKSALSGRFHNRPLSNRLVLMTNTQSPFEFFKFENEPIEQYLRRLTYVIRVEAVGTMDEEMKQTKFTILAPDRACNYHLREVYQLTGKAELYNSKWLDTLFKQLMNKEKKPSLPTLDGKSDSTICEVI